MTRALEQRRFASFDGVDLAFHVAGRGPLVVLLHGFASDSHRNWVEPGVTDALLDEGWLVVALDARGHGASDRPHDPAAYADGAMARDARSLLEHLGEPTASLCGYSMGGLTALRAAGGDPSLAAVVLGGIGPSVLEGGVTRRSPGIAEALLADDPREVADPVARAFRVFAGVTGADREALAAIQVARAAEAPWARDVELTVPALVLAGAADELVGDPAPLAAHLGAQLRIVPGNHLTCVLGPAFTEAIVAFLAEHRPAP